MIAPSRLPRNAFEAYAIAYGGRRMGLFSAWALPLAFVAGTPLAILVAITLGVNPKIPVGLLAIFATMSALGWLITARWRFSRTPLTPVTYPYQAASKMGGDVATAVIVTSLLTGGCLAIFALTPVGRDPGAFVAYIVALGIGGGLIAHAVCIASMLKYCPENYAFWLARTGNRPGPAPTSYRRFLGTDLIPPEEVYAHAIGRN